MGSDRHYPEEQPAHREHVAGFLIDEHPVTNAEFRRFVKDTGQRTSAETAPNLADFPDADAASLVPGSLLFRPTPGPVPLDDWRAWWHWTPGANWRAPEGPGSHLCGRERHPAVHISFEDALAYAEWADKELPTEVEWEYAARADREATTYAWGTEFMPNGRAMANTWHGQVPVGESRPVGPRPHQPDRPVPAERLGIAGHDRQRVGVDHVRVDGRSLRPRRGPLVLRPTRRPARRRSARDERRFASVRRVLLPALPSPARQGQAVRSSTSI
jgi:formylglycine-generating enzyme required for sulfatase activity